MSSKGKRITDAISFEKEGLENVDQAAFSDRNLIIGKNGSGKTRFLKTLELVKKQNQTKREKVITLYFSEIQAFYNSEQSKTPTETDELPSREIYPYDLLLEQEESSFFDFLKAMENDRADFLENILSVLSMRRGTNKNRDARNTLEDLNSFLGEFIDREICMDEQENQIYIQKGEHDHPTRKLLLREALSEFSPGELMLFYLCVFLKFLERKHPEGMVLIIDEPELHLHPRALVKMIQRLKESKNVSELWIASHSLFLVPLFEFEEIVFLKQNAIYCRNSHLYKELYDSLVGLENINLFEFLKSLDSWQYYQFIAECFCRPESVDKVDAKDEQFQKLLKSMQDNLKGAPVQLLDYGAGKCRIWECMQLLPDLDYEKSRVVYTAYEPMPEERTKKTFDFYDDFSKIQKEKKKFHAIVLMNVLHEIEVDKWEQTFQDITSVLDDNGILIFLEVLTLAKGEQPYGNTGYLVLQDEQVQSLFDDSNVINLRVTPKEKSNCWVLTKKQVENVTKDTIIKCIDNLQRSTYKELKVEFQKKIEYAMGNVDNQKKLLDARKYAFLSQQYINAILARPFLVNGSVGNSISENDVERNIKNAGQQEIRVTGIKPEYS